MNPTKNIFVACLLVVGTGYCHAQSFSLRPGSGATMIGDTFAVTPGAAFEIELWVEASASTPASGFGVVVTLAHDRYSGWPLPNTSSTHYGPPVDQKIVAAALQNDAPTLAAGVPFSILGGGHGFLNRIGRAPESGANIVANQLGAGMGPLGWYCGYFTPGAGTATISTPTHLLTYRFINNLAAGDTYGDATTETGLQVYSCGSTSTSVPAGSSGIAGNGHGGNFGSAKYKVTAVPEPVSLMSLGFGAALLVRRKRRA